MARSALIKTKRSPTEHKQNDLTFDSSYFSNGPHGVERILLHLCENSGHHRGVNGWHFSESQQKLANKKGKIDSPPREKQSLGKREALPIFRPGR